MVRLVTIMSVAFAAVLLMNVAVATDHTVGSPGGAWDLTSNFAKWSAGQTFAVGDNLVFNYASSHNVVEVSKPDYDACSTSNAIQTDNSGATTIKLTKPGKRYFICGTPGHCASGMKMQVNVLPSTTTKATSPSASSSPLPSLSPSGLPSPRDAFPPIGSDPTSAGGPALALSPLAHSAAGAVQPFLGVVVGAAAALFVYVF